MKMNRWSRIGIIVLTALIAGIFGAWLQCQSNWLMARHTEPEGYRVVGYDAASHQWTILRNGTFDGKYVEKRMTVVCNFYKWGNHKMVTGPDACNLQVGKMIIPNPFPPEGKRQEFIDAFEEPGEEALCIAEGVDADRVSQRFKILKCEVLSESRR